MQMMDHEKVNILLVDDQPAKLLAYEVILKELGENLVVGRFRPRSARIPAQERRRGHPGRRLHAGTRRFRARRHDPRASALPEDGDDLHLGDPGQRYRPAARLRDGRGRLRSGAGRAGSAARQDQGVRRALSQDPAAGAAQRRARGPRSRPHRGAGRIQRAAARKRAAPQPGDRRRQDGILGLGLGQRRLDVGRRPVPDLRRRSRQLRGDAGQRPGPAASGRRSTNCARRWAQFARARNPTRRNFGSFGPTARCAGASARRRRPSTRTAASSASAASPSTSPNASRPKNVRTCWPGRSITAPRTRWRWRNRSSA